MLSLTPSTPGTPVINVSAQRHPFRPSYSSKIAIYRRLSRIKVPGSFNSPVPFRLGGRFHELRRAILRNMVLASNIILDWMNEEDFPHPFASIAWLLRWYSFLPIFPKLRVVDMLVYNRNDNHRFRRKMVIFGEVPSESHVRKPQSALN